MQVSKDRLEVVRREEAALKDKLYPLEMEYSKEKSTLEEIRQLQRKKEELDEKEQRAELRNELAIVADIRQAIRPHHLLGIEAGNCSVLISFFWYFLLPWRLLKNMEALDLEGQWVKMGLADLCCL